MVYKETCAIFVVSYYKQWPVFAKKIQMTVELIAQLATLFLILGAGPIIVVVLYARGGNL